MKNGMKACAVVALMGGAGVAQGETLSITVENLLPADGTALTPVWFGFGDGSFETFTPGQATTAVGITEIAEVGDTGPITGRFASEQAGGTQLTFLSQNGAPVFTGGESETTSVNVSDAGTYRFLNFATMIVPTNDLFAGNSQGIEVFDEFGNFNGPIVIDIFGSNVWDNGSEVNDITDGPAFLQGVNGADGTDENGVARLLFGSGDDAGAESYLNSILGQTTAPGFDIGTVFGAGDLIARITITPAPGAAGLLAVAGIGAVRRRRA